MQPSTKLLTRAYPARPGPATNRLATVLCSPQNVMLKRKKRKNIQLHSPQGQQKTIIIMRAKIQYEARFALDIHKRFARNNAKMYLYT